MRLTSCKFFPRIVFPGIALIILGLFYWLGAPVWHKHKADQLLIELRENNASNAVAELIDLIESKAISKQQGDRILESLLEPSLEIRDQYLAGRIPVFKLQYRILEFRHLVLVYSGTVTFTNSVVCGFHGVTQRTATMAQRHPLLGLKKQHQIEPLTSAGTYKVDVVLKYALVPSRQSDWVFPSGGSGLETLIPTQVPRGPPTNSSTPIYSAEFRFPVSVQLTDNPHIKPIKLISNVKVDSQMRSAFHEHGGIDQYTVLSVNALTHANSNTEASNQLTRGSRPRLGWSVWFQHVPENASFSAKLQFNGKHELVSTNARVIEKGESGIILMNDFPDLIMSSDQVTNVTLIFFPNPVAAYDVPGINTLWNGTLSFSILSNAKMP